MAYDAAGRRQFYATVRRLATRLAVAGVPVIVDATATERAERHAARAALPRFAEVWVSTPLEQCRQRDPKGLYRASDAGEITHLPGVGSTYEPPLDPEFIYPGADVAPAQFAEQVVHQLAGWGWLSPEGRLE
jgi:adenylylsulfate kinase-like enzyme